MDTNVTKNSCKTNNNPINSNESNATEILQNLRVENPSRLIIGHFHISTAISNNMDIVILSEIKLDETFPTN